MEDTVRTIILSIDPVEIRKEVCAESACIALMAGKDECRELITGDHAALMNVFIENACVELASAIGGFLDAAQYRTPDAASLVRFPVVLPVDVKTPPEVFRRLIERAVAAFVLAECYEARAELSARLRERYAGLCAQLRRLLAPTAFRRAQTWL